MAAGDSGSTTPPRLDRRVGRNSASNRGAEDAQTATPASEERYRRALAALVQSRTEDLRKRSRSAGAPTASANSVASRGHGIQGAHGPSGASGSASGSGGVGARPSRTVFLLHERSGAAKALWVSLIWVVIGILMATADALSPRTVVQVSLWLSLFFLGVLFSFWVLFSLGRAVAATWAFIGTFLGPYSLTWQLWVTYEKHWKAFFPVQLYPFPIVIDEFEWYAMMTFGFIVFIASLAVLAHLSRSRPTYLRVHHESGEAYRLDGPP